ncbi:MAG TPA: PilZ domain-containing protein, partial [Planctomycetota bacterium]|nr:PilZ domain-containing protein [Planctomycetota bacterium]
MITQGEIARRLGLDVSSVNKILNKRAGPVFRKDTIKKVFKTARELGYDFGRLKYTHRRQFERREVAIGAEVLIVTTKDGSVYDQGVATIRDISLGGARVADLATPMGSLPTEPFTLTIRPMQKPLDEMELTGHIVRLHMNGQTSFGVEFSKLDAA